MGIYLRVYALDIKIRPAKFESDPRIKGSVPYYKI